VEQGLPYRLTEDVVNIFILSKIVVRAEWVRGDVWRWLCRKLQEDIFSEISSGPELRKVMRRSTSILNILCVPRLFQVITHKIRHDNGACINNINIVILYSDFFLIWLIFAQKCKFWMLTVKVFLENHWVFRKRACAACRFSQLCNGPRQKCSSDDNVPLYIHMSVCPPKIP
jgi:hypothetical protein